MADVMKKQPKMKKKEPLIGKIIECIILILLFALFVLPFYYMIISSFKNTFEAMAVPPVWWPEKFLWGNFKDAWVEANFAKYGWNSIVISAAVVVSCLICSVPSAFAFGRMEFKFKKPLWCIILSDMMVPVQCVFLPLFILFSDLGWLNTYGSMILLFTYSGSTIFFIRNAFMQVNNEVLEAARLDGASEWRIYFQLVLPNIKPAVLTVFIFQFVNIWNGLSKELVYDEQLKVVKVALEQISASNLYARMGSGMAGSVLLMIPPIVIFILMQRNVVETMTFAGMKEG